MTRRNLFAILGLTAAGPFIPTPKRSLERTRLRIRPEDFLAKDWEIYQVRGGQQLLPIYNASGQPSGIGVLLRRRANGKVWFLRLETTEILPPKKAR